jgi:hypothetical protein
MGAKRTPRPCVTCRRTFVGRDQSRFCSRGCQRRGTLEERFWSKVDRRGPGECWLWLGGKFKTGYGGFRIGDRSVKAHRVALELAFGERPPADMEVCHKCDVKVCCNPAHLFLGTHRDNMEDLARKLLHPNKKLTPEQVRSIRQLRAGGLTAAAVAERFGVSKGCVDGVVAGRTWRHVA